MTIDAHEEWMQCVQAAVNALSDSHMEIIPIYVEGTTLYEYDVTIDEENGAVITVYDIPFSSVTSEDGDTEAALKGVMAKVDPDIVAWVIRKPSAASNNLPSIIIPVELCRKFQIENITGLLIDNNIHHMANKYIQTCLDDIQGLMDETIKEIFDQK